MAFTIGNFDGVHLGHQAILATLRKTCAPTCVLTFVEHPFKLLRPKEVPSVITPFPIKRLFFQTDFCLLLPFTSALASMTYNELLDRLPISHLVLGKHSLFGQHREGTESNVRAWGKQHSVHIDYIDKHPGVSSTEIRNAIQRGNLPQAEQLLGRPHLLYAPSQRFSASHLTLPPDGTYVLSQGVATIQNQMIELSISIEHPTILSFNKEFYV
jgi:riboflavin kinase/FMN adenylyltransferase